MRRNIWALAVVALAALAVAPLTPAVAANATGDPPPMALPANPWTGAATFQSIATVPGGVMLVGGTTPYEGSPLRTAGIWVRGLRTGFADPAFGTNGTVVWPPDGALSTLHVDASGAAHALFTPAGSDRAAAVATVEVDGTPRGLTQLVLPEGVGPPVTELMSSTGVVLVRPSGTSAMTVERYLLDGTPDVTFGDASTVTVPVTFTASHRVYAALSEDGGVAVVVAKATGFEHVLFRLDPAGDVVVGPVTFPSAGEVGGVRSITTFGDRTMVASWTAVVAVLPDGTLDPTYGVDGVAAVPWGAHFWFNPDGSAVGVEYVLPDPGMVVHVVRLGTAGEVLAVHELPHPFQVALAARAEDGSFWLASHTAFRSDLDDVRHVTLLGPDGRANTGFPPRDLPSVGLGSTAMLVVWALGLLLAGASLASATRRPQPSPRSHGRNGTSEPCSSRSSA